MQDLEDLYELSPMQQGLLFHTLYSPGSGLYCEQLSCTLSGHLDTAAGVAGFIKTVLALKHGLIPPSLHFEQPNLQIDFEHSPFYVNTSLTPWPGRGTPRRAGVSSFGIGGTNAHVVLEEAPLAEPCGESRPWQLLVLSAKTASALESATTNLAADLKAGGTAHGPKARSRLGRVRGVRAAQPQPRCDALQPRGFHP